MGFDAFNRNKFACGHGHFTKPLPLTTNCVLAITVMTGTVVGMHYETARKCSCKYCDPFENNEGQSATAECLVRLPAYLNRQ